MPVVARIGMLWLLLWAWAVLPGAPAQAVPLTTKYYSLTLPADWVVVNLSLIHI